MRRLIHQGALPVRHGMVFRVHAAPYAGSAVTLRDTVGGLLSQNTVNIGTSLQSNGRKVFTVSAGAQFNLTTGVMSTENFAVAATSAAASVSSSSFHCHDLNSADAAQAWLRQFRDLNQWGAYRRPQNSQRFTVINSGASNFTGGVARIVMSVATATNNYALSFNGQNLSGTGTSSTSGIPAITHIRVGISLNIRELFAFNRVLSSTEIDIIQRYQKYDTGS